MICFVLGVLLASVEFSNCREVRLYRAPNNASVDSFFITGNSVVLSGSIVYLGEYYFPLVIGGQSINVQLDSGSSALAVPVVLCATDIPACSSTPGKYAPVASPTYQAIPCNEMQCQSCAVYNDTSQCAFSESFGDGSSISGVLGSDVVELDGLNTTATFGMILSETGVFSSPLVPGILGLAQPALDCLPTCVTPLLDLLWEHNQTSLVFGICLGCEGGGMWDVGEIVASRAAHQEIFYSPLDTTSSYYQVTLLSIESSSGPLIVTPSQQVNLQSTTAIVDSGTTLLVVPSWFFSALQTAITSQDLPGATSLFAQQCLCLTADEIQQYPVIFFVLPSANSSQILYVPLSPANYLLNFDGEVCLGIQSQPTNLFVLGDLFLQGLYTVFDQRNKVMGFSSVANDTCGEFSTSNPFLTSCDGSGTLAFISSLFQVSLNSSSGLPMPMPSSTEPLPSTSSPSSAPGSPLLSTTDILLVALSGFVVIVVIVGTVISCRRCRIYKYDKFQDSH